MSDKPKFFLTTKQRKPKLHVIVVVAKSHIGELDSNDPNRKLTHSANHQKGFSAKMFSISLIIFQKYQQIGWGLNIQNSCEAAPT